MSEETKKKQTMSIWIQAKKELWESEYSYSASSWEMLSMGYIPVNIIQLEYTPATQEELTLGHVKVLEKKLESVMAENFIKETAIREEIQSLLAIGVITDV